METDQHYNALTAMNCSGAAAAGIGVDDVSKLTKWWLPPLYHCYNAAAGAPVIPLLCYNAAAGAPVIGVNDVDTDQHYKPYY